MAATFIPVVIDCESGLASARPAARLQGLLYYATDTNALSRDTGSAWETVRLDAAMITTGQVRLAMDNLTAVDLPAAPALAAANTFTVAPQQITINAAGNKGLIIKEAGSQTANPLEVTSSADALLGGFDKDGVLIQPAAVANTVFSGPTTGADAAPALRALVAADTPAAAILAAANAFTVAPQQITCDAADHVGKVVKGAGSQTADLQRWTSSADAILTRINKGGYIVIAQHAAPADGDLAAGDCAIWFDQTDGAAKLMIKAKSANGTVAAAAVALA